MRTLYALAVATLIAIPLPSSPPSAQEVSGVPVVGVAVGASVAGKIVDVAGANAAFLVATVSAGAAALCVGAFQKLLHVPAEHAAQPALAA